MLFEKGTGAMRVPLHVFFSIPRVSRLSTLVLAHGCVEDLSGGPIGH